MTPRYYKKFYEDNHTKLLQYESLRSHFSKLTLEVFGPLYYNDGMDVYECDRIICEQLSKIARKKKPLLSRLVTYLYRKYG